MLVKIKYSWVHEPELITGNALSTYSEVNCTHSKVKICVIYEYLQGL